MHDEYNNEEQKDDRSTCPTCGLRQYGSICANCGIDINNEEDPEKKKEDEYDEYDYRERR